LESFSKNNLQRDNLDQIGNNSELINLIKKDYFLNKFLPLHWSLWSKESKILLTLIFAWSCIGIFVLGSASWWAASKEYADGIYYLRRQLLWLIPSLSIFTIVIHTRIRFWLKISKSCFYIFMILIVATIFFGSSINGSSRWLILGNLQMQPSELIKPFAILVSANFFSYWKNYKISKKIKTISIFAILILLIMKQPNLSTAALIGSLFWIIGLASGVRYKSLLSASTIGLILGIISIIWNDYQRLRIISFLNPWDDPQGRGYQLIQSLFAIGSGGMFGEGFGLSMQKLQYLPIQNTDFIFAVFAEEFGFLGSFLFIVFLIFFAYLGLKIALRASTNQIKLIVIGSISILVGQSIMHIAVATGTMPTTGLPLPFVSYGGNSLISSFFIAGLLIRASIESSELFKKSNLTKRYKQI
tara:strand:+ start:25649 stop:26893 length:1245 start_codon:yes stop_codon:yes gene_type:complete